MRAALEERVRIPYGEEKIALSVPKRNLAWVISPADVPASADDASSRLLSSRDAFGPMRREDASEEGEIRHALAHAIGTPPLAELASHCRKAVILVDDSTRATPQRRILPVLLDELNRADVSDEAITVIIALGTHRPMAPEECLSRFGAEVMGRVEVVNHPFDDPSQLVDLGETASGIPISVNRRYYESDFSIAVGNIIPHIYAGWSGGAKMVQPGVCGPETTAATHFAAAGIIPQILAVLGNPIRREIDEVARRSGLSMILNTVLNRKGGIVKVVAGDVTEAFKAGVKAAEPIYTAQVEEHPDIVVASSHPADLDLWQAAKALIHGGLMAKAGGTLILATPSGQGVARQHPIVLELGDIPPAEVRRRTKRMSPIELIGAASHMAMGAIRERVDVVIVSDGMKEWEARRLGFGYAHHVQEALEEAVARHGAEVRVGVLTHGGDVAPRRSSDAM